MRKRERRICGVSLVSAGFIRESLVGSSSFIEDILLDYDVDMMTWDLHQAATDLTGLEADLLAERTKDLPESR